MDDMNASAEHQSSDDLGYRFDLEQTVCTFVPLSANIMFLFQSEGTDAGKFAHHRLSGI